MSNIICGCSLYKLMHHYYTTEQKQSMTNGY